MKIDFQDASLDQVMVVGDKERLRYSVAEKWDAMEKGQEIHIEDVFGDTYADDQINAFWDVLILVNSFFVPFSLPTDEELESQQYEGESGEVRLLNRLGDYFLFVMQDEENGLHYFELAAQKGSGYANTRIGGYHLNKYNDIDKAIDFYLKAICLDGDANALMDLALCFIHGKGLQKNLQLGRELMMRSALQGHPAARYNIGWFYQSFEVAEFNIDAATQWYKLSAKDYYEQALYALYNLYGNTEDNLYYAERFAKYGFPTGLYYLGCSYLDGILVESDPQKGFQMIKDAADQGYPDAAKRCSECYASGFGTEINEEMSEYYSVLARRILDSDSEYAYWKKPYIYIKE